MHAIGGWGSGGGRWAAACGGLAAAGAGVLLASLAGCADEADVAEALPDGAGPAGPVAFEDHWHAAFGIYVCDRFLPATPEFDTPAGIHTHGDGVIHIHPFTPEAAGEGATLRVFLDDAGIGVSGDELRVDGETYTAGEDTCGDGDDADEAEVVVVRWADVADAPSEPERVDADARFRQDGEGYVVAFVAEGADVPEPPSADRLEELAAADSSTGGASGTTAAPPSSPSEGGAGGPDGTDTSVAGDDRPLADGFYPVHLAEPAPCRTPGLRADAGGESCYLLPDEPVLGPEIVESAEPSPSPSPSPDGGGWQVALTLTDDGIDAFNAVAAGCYRQGSTCPLGQLALVVDGRVVTAPTISEPSYRRDEISVSGAFTEAEARAVADALEG